MQIDFIYGIDVGVDSKRTPWVKIDNTGTIVNIDNNLAKLAKSIDNDEKHKIAFGIEAPMWLPKLCPDAKTGNFHMSGRFTLEDKNLQWFQGIAAQATIKAIIIGNYIVGKTSRLALNSTKCLQTFESGTKSILLYEGFAAGASKPDPTLRKSFKVKNLFSQMHTLSNKDQVDAYIIAAACLYGINGVKHPNFPSPKARHFEIYGHISNQIDQKTTLFTLKRRVNLTRNDRLHQAGIHCVWDNIFQNHTQTTQMSTPQQKDPCNIYAFQF
jgi:hypothetical protein